MDDKLKTDMSEHAWRYFILHAEQRLKTFNFYLILCTVLFGGMATLIQNSIDTRVGIFVSILLSFFSFVFWKLDLRNKQLIKHGENALKHLEELSGMPDNSGVPHVLKIFCNEDFESARLKQRVNDSCFAKYYSYSTLFHYFTNKE